MRVGFGFDAHAFDPQRPLVLGGVTISPTDGLAGHSDADVLSHAIAAALLGAANLGDLGSRWPSTEEWKGASSVGFLSQVSSLLKDSGWKIDNVDSTVVTESPRLAPFRDQMISSVASALEINDALVSIKATSTDGLGFTGHREGMAAYAVVSISRVEP
jgi:2-C-methyl-D-erythritol 2,4-cyclodiphosphate synthase